MTEAQDGRGAEPSRETRQGTIDHLMRLTLEQDLLRRCLMLLARVGDDAKAEHAWRASALHATVVWHKVLKALTSLAGGWRNCVPALRCA
jgi:hypothetical protein